MQQEQGYTILFTGYAPVHFLCFRPLYERLVRCPQLQVFLSGGLRTKTESGYDYDERGLYDPFGIPQEHVLSVSEMRKRDFDVLFAANTKLIPLQSASTRVQMFHGISFRNRAIRAENRHCDYYFIVGPYMRRKFAEANLFPKDDPRVVEVGFPKTDALVNGELDREDLLRRYGFNGLRPVVLYAPTGEKYNSLEIMGKEVIQRLTDCEKYDLLIKPHDHPKNKKTDWFSELAFLEGPHTKIVRTLDVVPLLFLADLLLTDASSVSNEYTLLDRPIVYLDVPKLLARMMERKGSMFDLDTWGRRGGRIVKNPETIVDVVDASLANPSEASDVRKEMAADLFYHPGQATEVAFKWLIQMLEATRKQPAPANPHPV